ncbi:formimidoylglutamate deiminase [Sphingomonas sp. HH69]
MSDEAKVKGSLHFRQALLPSGWAPNVRLTVEDGLITAIAVNQLPRQGDTRLAVGLPGMPNLHSHAFQRGMAGLAETRGPGDDSFWTWREVMYRFADRIDAEQLRAIAALAYIEMLESGFTRVGEFHYVHHDGSGAAFANPAEMTQAIVAAAAETGIALTHLPVFYAHSGFGGIDPSHAQRRFVHDIESFARLIDAATKAVSPLPDAIVGIAPHSLRAVTPEELRMLEQLAGETPIHIHIAEQLREVEDCVQWSGARPVAWLLDNMPVDGRWCLVHATHVSDEEAIAFGRSGAVAGLCPITEANLGDGIFPAEAFLAVGGRFGVGSDSNVLVDMTEELRLLEYGQRLNRRSRNILASGPGASTGQAVFQAAHIGGSRALGVEGGLRVGNAADIISLDDNHPSLFGRQGGTLLDSFLFASGKAAIDTVWRRGEEVVSAGRHRARDFVVARYRMVLEALVA